MSTDNIKVTVIVPTHNTAGLVTRNIASLAGQTMPDGEYEVIYVDDGSTDATADVVAKAIVGRPNFTLIRSTNSGWPGRPRNLGLDAARGEFVFFSDDDDWLEPDALRLLHARAIADEADIVIGRIAGHGRGGHRAVSQASMTGGDIRSPHCAVLLKSMTVHKLYRRALLEDNNLRFEEGRVRLEDHIFALRAYLRTSRVSIVHDRTVYHWIRHQDGGNHSFGNLDPEAYATSIGRIFAIICDEIDDPVTRRRFLHNWYQRKVLKHAPQAHFLDGSTEYADTLVQANQRLIDKWIPLDADAELNNVLRIRASLLRLGRTDLLRVWGRYERGIGMRSDVKSCEWIDGKLVVRFSVELVSATGETLAFIRQDGRVRRDLPLPLRGVAAITDICDVTEELAKSRVRVLIRNREPSGDLHQPTSSTLVESPLGGGRFAARFDVEVAIDPLTADNGRPIFGTWDLYAMLDPCGHFLVRRVGAGRNLELALPAHRLQPTNLTAKPLVTGYGNVSLRVKPGRFGDQSGGSSGSLARRVRRTARRMHMSSRRALRRLRRHALRSLPPRAVSMARRVSRIARRD